MVQKSLRLYPQDSDCLSVRQSVAKKNCGIYYSLLTSLLFGGELTPRTHGDHISLRNGELRNGSVDVIVPHEQGAELIEVKSGSQRDKRVFFSQEQIRNHFADFLDELILKGNPAPDLSLVYYLSRTHSPSSRYQFLYGHSHPGFVKTLSHETSSLVKIPSNLFYAFCLTLLGETYNKDKTKAPDKGTFIYRSYAEISSCLHNSPQPVEGISNFLLSDERGPKLSPEILARLHLEDLFFEEKLSSNLERNIKFRILDKKDGEHVYRVKPFKVRIFYMPPNSREEWLADLKKNHVFWLQDVLGVRDLYYETHEAGEAYEVPKKLQTTQDRFLESAELEATNQEYD